MQLSIIIPALNEAGNIAATLAPLQALRARGAEVILADGGSTDATLTLATNLVDRMCVSARGRAVQMNAGAAIAHGEVLWFLHADSIAPDHADNAIFSAFANTANVWGRFDVDISGTHPMLGVVAWMMNQRSRLTGIATGDQGIFIRRTVFENIGGFPDQPLMEDIEICRQLKKMGKCVALRQKIVTSGRRWEQHGVWRTIVLMWWLRFRYFCGASPAAIHRRYYGK